MSMIALSRLCHLGNSVFMFSISIPCSWANSIVFFIHVLVSILSRLGSSRKIGLWLPASMTWCSMEILISWPVIVSMSPCWIIVVMWEIPCAWYRSIMPSPLRSCGNWSGILLMVRTIRSFGNVLTSNGLMILLHWFFVRLVAGSAYSRDFVIVVCSATMASTSLRYPLASLSPHSVAFSFIFFVWVLQFPSAAIHTPKVSLASERCSCVRGNWFLCLSLTISFSLCCSRLYFHSFPFHRYLIKTQCDFSGAIAPPVVRKSSSQTINWACARNSNSPSVFIVPCACTRSASSTKA